MTKTLTKKQFEALCKKYTPIYIATEYKEVGNKTHCWSVWAFAETEGEYHEREDNK